MNPELVMPRRSGWALPDDALEFLSGVVTAMKPALIVECGSGRSTVALADTLRGVGSGKLVALEHKPDLAADYRTLIVENGLGEIADLRDAPITDGWYHPDAWSDLHGIEVLLVDGPPGDTPMARVPAVPLLRDRLTPRALVVLDDTNRPDEQAALEEWQRLGLGEPTFVPHSTGELAYAYMP